MATRTFSHRPGFLFVHTRAHMTVKAKIMKHFFDISCNVCCILVAVITASTSALVHIVVMTLYTTGTLVISVLKGYSYHLIRWRLTTAKLFRSQ